MSCSAHVCRSSAGITVLALVPSFGLWLCFKYFFNAVLLKKERKKSLLRLSFKIPALARQLFVEALPFHLAFLSHIADFENRNIITSVQTALSRPGEGGGDQLQRTLGWYGAHRHIVIRVALSESKPYKEQEGPESQEPAHPRPTFSASPERGGELLLKRKQSHQDAGI